MKWSKAMFCVECGKETKIFKNGTCLNCYIKNTRFSKGPEILDIDTCSKCSAYRYKNTWSQRSFQDVLKQHVKDSFQISKELKKIKIESECKEGDKAASCKIYISGIIDDHEITEQHPLTVRLKKTTCDVCSKQYGGYYEAILQIRADKRKPSPKELTTLQSKIEAYIASLRAKGNKRLFITDISKEPNGLDFFLSEKGSAFSLAKKIQEQYGGEIKQSSTNIGMKDGRQIYRMTYLLRLPHYCLLDIIQSASNVFLIENIIGNKVQVIDLQSWQQKTVDGKALKNSRVLGNTDLIKEMMIISQTPEELQLMDPSSYQIVEVKKPVSKEFRQKTIGTLNIEGTFFLVPRVEKKEGE